MKKIGALGLGVIAVSALVGCNNNEGALDTRYNDNTQPIGYYTNENHRNGVDNEGPITEMLDNTARNNGTMQVRNGDQNNASIQLTNGKDQNGVDNEGPITELIENTDRNNGTMQVRNGDQNNDDYSRSDLNYHGQVANDNYYSDDERALAEKISDQVSKVNNVDDVNTIVTDDNIIVAVDTNDRNNQSMKNTIEKEVEKLANGKNTQIITDEATFTRVRNIDNDIRNGKPVETIDASIQELMDDAGDVLQSPVRGIRDMTR